MKAIRKFADQPLTWTQLRIVGREYELRSEDGVVATLRWPTFWSSLARGETAEGAWTMERGGWMNPHVTLFPADSTLEVGVLNLGWGEGMFSGANGGRYRWVRRSFWRGEWAFTDEKDETLVSFTPQPGFFKFCMAVKVSPQAIAVPERSLLTLLGCYVLILAANDAAASSAASVAVG